MGEKYDSTDFWYTFINSLPNKGLAYGKGDWELDDETQDNILEYLRERLRKGARMETTLPS